MAVVTVLVSAIFAVILSFVSSAPEPTLTPLLESLCSQAVSAVPNDYPREVYLCAEKSGMTTEQLEGINLTSIDTDDKCFVKCIMASVGYLTEDGEPMLDSVTTNIKTRFPPKYQDYFINSYKSCVADADKIVKSDGGRKGAPCKFAVSLSQCLQVAETEFCNQRRANGP